MHATQLRKRDISLPENVLISVTGVSKAAPRPEPQPPPWLARFLPGVKWSAVPTEDVDDDTDDSDLDEDEGSSSGLLQEVSFEVAAGSGLGLVGDVPTTRTLLRLLVGLYPPSTGRIVVRGRVAPLLRFSEVNFSSGVGRPALKVISNFLGWPHDFL